MASGFYSIVQFMPNAERQEGVNVGVLLLETGGGHFNFILTRPVRRIRAMFRDVSVTDVISASVRFYNTVMATGFYDLDDLTEFCLTQKGLLRCTEPQYVRVTPGDFNVVLHDLCDRLVLSENLLV